MAEATANTCTETPKPLSWESLRSRWPVFMLMLAGSYVVASVFVGLTRSDPAQSQTQPFRISDTHCAEFIALARANFGPDWRYRLDPRDTTCAREVQAEWDRQSSAPRQPRVAEPLPSSSIFGNNQTPDIQDTVDTEAALPPLAETQCLNVISLARAKFGPDWPNQVAPADAARCAAPIQKSLGQ